MPRHTPVVKVERTRGFAAEVILHGGGFDEAREFALRLAGEQGLTFVHPFDDLAVIAGQGTIALEMLRQQPTPDTLVIAVGGAGLISGIATVARALAPPVEVIGVQTRRSPPCSTPSRAPRPPQGRTRSPATWHA